MFKSYEDNGLHHVNDYTVDGVKEFIAHCMTPEAWRYTEDPNAAVGLKGPAKGLGILVLYLSLWFSVL